MKRYDDLLNAYHALLDAQYEAYKLVVEVASELEVELDWDQPDAVQLIDLLDIIIEREGDDDFE